MENNIQALSKSLSNKKRELQEDFCSAECRTNFVEQAWKGLVTDYLERITGIHFALLQARSAFKKAGGEDNTRYFVLKE